MLDITDLYAMFQDRYEQEPDIPSWAPYRSAVRLTEAQDRVVTRYEKKLGRRLNYNEGQVLMHALATEGPSTVRFIDRVQRCTDCGKWTYKQNCNKWGICDECIPF